MTAPDLFPRLSLLIPDWRALPVESRQKLYRATLGYAFSMIGYYDYTTRLKAHTSASPADIRDWVRRQVLHNGYLMHNCKHWLLATVAGLDHDVVVSEQDQRRMIALLTGPLLRGLQALYAAHGYQGQAHTQAMLARVWADTRSQVTGFCWVKMRFVYQQQGLEQDDMADILMLEGLRALRRKWPAYPSELYARNLLVRTAKNTGLNIIDRVTTGKHARLIRDDQGDFHSLTVPWDAAVLVPDIRNDPHLVTGITGRPMGEGVSSVDVAMTLARIAETATDVYRSVMKALSTYDPAFSHWLGQHGHGNDNEAVRHRISLNSYLRLVAGWLDCPLALVVAHVQSLRRNLKDYA